MDDSTSNEPRVLPARSYGADSDLRKPLGKWSTKRVAGVLIAGVAAAVIVTATATSLVSRREPSDSSEVAVLGVDARATAPPIFGNWECVGVECVSSDDVDSTVFESFRGVSLFTIPGERLDQDESAVCLVLMKTSEMSATPQTSFSGPILTGCSAGEFPAAVQMTVSTQFPQEFRDEFPDGSGFQFTLDGDEVVVLRDGSG